MTLRTAAIAMSVVAPEIAIIHRTLETKPAAGSLPSSSTGLLMEPDIRREEVIVSAADAGGRLDRLIAASISDVSRSRLKGLILAGEVTIGGRTIRDPSHRVNAGDVIVVAMPSPEPAEPQCEPIALKVVFEDDQIIVIDKPAGLVVHPAAGNWSGTLVNALLHHCKALSGIGGEQRPGIVHRLDKETSGCLVAAKNDAAHQTLARQFAGREVT